MLSHMLTASAFTVDAKKSDDWEGHWFNPVAFAQQWYEDHPEVLDKMIADEKRMLRIRKEGP